MGHPENLSLLESLDISAYDRYQLPGDPVRDVHVVPLSGGADSTVLALLMKRLFPAVSFRFVFTDTGAEDETTYENLDRLERWLGQPIDRVQGAHDLFSLIDHYGGFLPGANSRWCTRELKLRPFESYLGGLRDQHGSETQMHSYIGLRADETERVSLVSRKDWIHTHTPFRELGIRRADVFRILDETLGIPRFYTFKTRSGCTVCPYVRSTEIIGLYFNNRKAFEVGERLEKLSFDDFMRYPDNALPFWKEIGFGANHVGLPIPARIDARSADRAHPFNWKTPVPGRGNRSTVDLYVGAEFFIHPGVGAHGVWLQRPICFSRTRGGLNRQLNGHWAHRLNTAEVMGLSQDQMRDELKLAAYRIELPAHLVDIQDPHPDSYTWQKGKAYAQIRHLMGWVERTLNAAELQQRLQESRGASEGGWLREQRDSELNALSRVEAPHGRLTGMDLHVPPDDTPEADENETPCLMCAL